MTSISRFAFSAALLASIAQAQSQVWIVDDHLLLGADFELLHEGIQGASDGDIVLVRTGVYVSPSLTPSVIKNKGLTIVGEGIARIDGELVIRDTTATQPVAVRDINIANGGLTMVDTTAPVWIEDIDNVELYCDVEALRCDSLVLNRVEMVGTQGLFTVGTAGLALEDTFASAYDCSMAGGPGWAVGDPGAAGVNLVNSTLFASGAAIQTGGAPTTDGVQSGTSASYLVDSPASWTVFGGTHAEWAGTKRVFKASALAREGEFVQLDWVGVPGETAVLAMAPSPTTLLAPAVSASLLITQPSVLQTMGPVSRTGALHKEIQVPELGGGVEGAVFYSQGGFVDFGTGSIRLGGGSATVLLDQGVL